MKRLLLVTAAVLAAATPATAVEVTVGAEELSFQATITLPQFPCPAGCTGSGSISITSATGGPVLTDTVAVTATDLVGCTAGSLRLSIGTAAQSSTTTFDLVRSTLALAGTGVHDQYAISRTRNYVVEGAMAPATVDPAALAVACLAGAPLQNVTFKITAVGERAEASVTR